MTINKAVDPTVSHALEDSVNCEVPLAGISQCHLGIISQLQAFAELPALQAAAAQSRSVMTHTLTLFQYAVYGHHADEENALFPAVLRSAAQGEEAKRTQAMVQRLTAEHREIEARWKKLEPAVRAAAKADEPGDLDFRAVEELVQAYLAHAHFEEQQFLPLAEAILGRNGNHMAALGLLLDLRHPAQVAGVSSGVFIAP
jgi:hypothetical protein